MKKKMVSTLLVIVILSLSLILCCCAKEIDNAYRIKYTPEEHIARIKERALIRFDEKIKTGEIENVDVDVVYGIDESLRFFVVEITYTEARLIKHFHKEGEYIRKKEEYSKYAHCVGYIEDDVYKNGLTTNEIGGLIPGKSAYSISEIKGKKYYAQIEHDGQTSGVFIVESEGKKLKIFDEMCLYKTIAQEDSIEFHDCGQDYVGNESCEVYGSFKYSEIKKEDYLNPQYIQLNAWSLEF